MRRENNSAEEEDETKIYQKVLDDLLDKINLNGYESLTPEEKELLEKVSKRLNKRIDD